MAWVLLAMSCCALQETPSPVPAPTDSQSVYGTWYSYPPGNPETDSIRHEFRHNRATNKDELIVTRMCRGDYRAVIARAVSPIEITDSTIRVLKNASATEKGELNSVCTISIQPGLWSYTLSPEKNRMTITNPGGKPDIMELARQDATSSNDLPVTLYGTWSMPVRWDRDTNVLIKLVFYGSADPAKGTVRQIATCMKGNDTLTSQVESEISVSERTITILKSTSHTQKDGPFNCRVNITAGTIRYSLSPTGTTMTLTSPGGEPLRLTREAPND
jgi:hypothetical protein